MDHTTATPLETPAEQARRAAQHLLAAAEAQEWTSFGELVHEDAVFEFVGRAVLHGRDEIIAYERSIHDGRMRSTCDLWTADDTGRVWWRFAAEWDDPDAATPRRTTGASTVVVRDGAVESFSSWVDLSFLLPAS